ncbi:MAG: hypothetical protein BGO33_08335 [Bacteroidia bacterium 43-41]|nr:MAG: hypothetical protein BGO33_08335 [Bacteroidia bacterium 43-41]
MVEYLEFKDAKCKDCYKCLRECPVKAIEVINHQAKIIKDRCILCGKCTVVCPQNAKIVHSELNRVYELLKGNDKVIASVAPSFISNFDVEDFTAFKIALRKLGFYDAEETAVGAQMVVREYKRLMDSGRFRNLITSACPAACRMIQTYYPKALKYLAPVDSPMLAHAKMIHGRVPDARIVFIGPCIAKKREAKESGLIDGVLTFEDLDEMFKEENIILSEISNLPPENGQGEFANLSKTFPVSQGIIKSFEGEPVQNFVYMAVDGAKRCVEALENMESLSNVFLELNTCHGSCINGPCNLPREGGIIKATAEVQAYVKKEIKKRPLQENPPTPSISLFQNYPRIRDTSKAASESEIRAILAKSGKLKPEDELNCGTCGYSTCRDKARAVFNGYAEIEICLPYMRERAESMSYEIIHNSPNGVIVLDDSIRIVEINAKAREVLGIPLDGSLKGMPAMDYFDASDYVIAYNTGRNTEKGKVYIPKTQSYINLSINVLKNQHIVFAIVKDITSQVNYEDKLTSVKLETLETTDNVIKKQMRVAQEIASLLGETTAETKVALLKLKEIFQKE